MRNDTNPNTCRCGQEFHPVAGHCTGCHKSWAGTGGHDAHRTGPFSDRRCLTTDELLAAGWSVTRRDGTDYWGRPLTPEGAARLAATRARKAARRDPGRPLNPRTGT
jgi:hypothetical protein